MRMLRLLDRGSDLIAYSGFLSIHATDASVVIYIIIIKSSMEL